MSDQDRARGRDLGWSTMPPMEQAVWATSLVIHHNDEDGGVDAANTVIDRLRDLGITRMHQPKPEYLAAQAKALIRRADFMIWYPIQHRN